jgi:hypothetical protein
MQRQERDQLVQVEPLLGSDDAHLDLVERALALRELVEVSQAASALRTQALQRHVERHPSGRHHVTGRLPAEIALGDPLETLEG